MNILIVIPAYIPDLSKGGSVRGCHEFAKTCKESSIEVTVSTLDTCNTKKYSEVVDGINVLRFNPTNFLDNIAKSGFGFSINWVLWFLQNAKKYDLIYFRSIWNFPSLIGPLYCWLIKKSFGFCASGKLSAYAMKQSRWKKILVLLVFQKIMSKASFIHYATKQEREEQVVNFFKEIRPIILPPSVQIPEKIIENNQLKYYSVSRINPIKNIEYIFNNFPNCNYPFTLYGEYLENDPYIKKLLEIKKLRNKNQVNEMLKFGNYINKKKLDMEYGLGSIFIICSNSEGLSNAALEALSRGSVVIASQ